jgi:hypothetical protein
MDQELSSNISSRWSASRLLWKFLFGSYTWYSTFDYFTFSEGQIPKGAIYIGSKESVDGEVKHTDTYYILPSGEKQVTSTKTEKKAPKYEGIGPTNDAGLPIAFRSVRSIRFIFVSTPMLSFWKCRLLNVTTLKQIWRNSLDS